jgi:hypothetical protein
MEHLVWSAVENPFDAKIEKVRKELKEEIENKTKIIEDRLKKVVYITEEPILAELVDIEPVIEEPIIETNAVGEEITLNDSVNEDIPLDIPIIETEVVEDADSTTVIDPS